MNRALRAATVGVLLLSPVVLSACSAGQVAQTATELRDKTGGRAHVGDLSLREAALSFPDGGSYASGGDAELQLAIANDGTQGDTLTGISGRGFSGAVFTDKSSAAAATAAKTSASATPLATATGAPVTSGGTPPASAPAPAPTSAAPTSSAPTSSAPTSSASPAAPTELAIPAGQTVFVGTGTTHITLTGLDSALTTGQYVTLTLSFQKAGDVTIKATVANPTTPLKRSDSFNFDKTGG